jgi:hypothetical protein
MKSQAVLTEEKFQEIYSNEKFRNEVAFAHSCLDSNNNFMYKQTCSYPTRYIVEEWQIVEAKKERNRRKKEVIKQNENTLIFVGMGLTYEGAEDDPCNYRIRTEILNPEGKRYFIELGPGMRCDHAVDRDMEEKYNSKVYEFSQKARKERESKNFKKETFYREKVREYLKQPYYNFKGIERKSGYLGAYTKTNIIKLVNDTFDCNFKTMIVDNYNLSTDDFKSISPKK